VKVENQNKIYSSKSAVSAPDSCNQSVIFDSGASNYMFPTDDGIINFSHNKNKIILADGKTIIGSGDFGPLKNVIIVPDLKEGLISTASLDKDGKYSVFGDGKVLVVDQ
jgi:hypothetical protein